MPEIEELESISHADLLSNSFSFGVLPIRIELESRFMTPLLSNSRFSGKGVRTGKPCLYMFSSKPPSQGMRAPRMNEAAGDARYTHSAPTSIGSPKR